MIFLLLEYPVVSSSSSENLLRSLNSRNPPCHCLKTSAVIPSTIKGIRIAENHKLKLFLVSGRRLVSKLKQF